jgi:peptidyl-prolyl cis-trans isomerase SurA
MQLRILILCALYTAFSLCSSVSVAQNLELSDTGVRLDGIVAVVNDGVVLESELRDQISMVVNRLRDEDTSLPPMNILQEQVLESLIIKQIQLQRAQRAGIDVPDEMLNRALADIARRNGTSLSELPDLLEKDGVNYGAYRNEMREQMTIEGLRQRDVISKIGVNPRELEDYLERQENTAYRDNRYLVSHILISVPAAATQQQLEEVSTKAWDIYDQLQNGADFAQLAVSYSNAQTALDGGTMGWRDGNALPSMFAEIVPNMQNGQVSEPIRTPSGFHIIKLDNSEGTTTIIEEQTLARHILIKTTEILDDDIVQQKLVDIREEIIAGDDFAAIAKAVSEDPGSAVEGGELGWTGPGAFVPEFEQTMSELEFGEISQPIQSPFGWHIIEVLERRTHDTTDDVRRQKAMMAIRNGKVAEETELWIRQIRDEAFVEYRT